jgi:tetratricopeptide (TPR) repeat protein
LDLDKLGRHDEALEHYKKSLQIAQQTGNALDEGDAHWNIACLYKNSHAMEAAMEAAMLAHSSFSACLGAKHPRTQNVKRAIESILQQCDFPFPLMKAALTEIGRI